jgi:hypothetical protein
MPPDPPAASTRSRVIPIVALKTGAADELAGSEGDSSVVASLYQADKKIYARSVSGLFSRWRWTLVWATQLVFYGIPWLSLNDRQAVLFELASRRFYIFNLVLYPQDLI